MIDPDDNDVFGWAPETRNRPDSFRQYDFLTTVPLRVKREMFRTMNRVLGDCDMADIFNTQEQMHWAVSIAKFGMQLPLEDIGMITDAFKQYSDVLFILHRVDFENDTIIPNGSREDDGNAGSEVSARAALELISNPGTIFNPRVFFEDELPLRQVAHQFSGRVGSTYESFMLQRQLPIVKPDRLNKTILSVDDSGATMPNLGRSGGSTSESTEVAEPKVLIEESDDDEALPRLAPKAMEERAGFGNAKLSVSALPPLGYSKSTSYEQDHVGLGNRPRTASCAVLRAHIPQERGSGYSASTTIPAIRRPPTASRVARAVKLWDQYIELLSHAIQVYSTIIRGLRPLNSANLLKAVFGSLLHVVDMLLSQGGNNPRLKPWTDKYRCLIGPELWDKTWATIGDRLEPFAIKLAFDIWGRSISVQHTVQSDLLRIFEHWLHRDKVMEAWLRMVSLVAQRVLRVHYPHDKSSSNEKLVLRLADFSISGTTTDEDAKQLLKAYVSTPVDFKRITSRSYLLYANTVCDIINNALNISKVIEVDGKQFAQMPPTANFVLKDFELPLFRMALYDYMASRDFVVAKRSVFTILCRLLIMAENPIDPISPASRNRILCIIDQAIGDGRHVQIILPNVPSLLKNLPHARVFIPAFFDLVRQVLPTVYNVDLLIDEPGLRNSAYVALSTLTAYVGYYHRIGRSSLIAERDSTTCRDINERTASSKLDAPPLYAREAVKELLEKIEQCQFRKTERHDAVFVGYLKFIFQTLMSSVLTEKAAKNLQHLTCLILTFLHQYACYNTQYVLLFIELYIDQFQKSRDERTSAIYINGLNQAATVTWQANLSQEQYRQILAMVVQALSSCDQDLRRYTHWSPYHQVFITSIRCLISWTSVTVEHSLMPPDCLARQMALLMRCNKFLGSVNVGSQHSSASSWGRKLQLTTSTDFVDPMSSPGGLTPSAKEFADSALSTDENSSTGYITSYTILGLFGHRPNITMQSHKKESKPRVRKLSRSLYRVLSTTVAVFSTIILRGMDSDQQFGSHAPSDILLIRMSLYQNIVPDNNILLKACRPEIIKMLRGYVPVSVDFYSAFRRAIYSKISFKRYYNGRWSDSVNLVTARYPSGSKQWLYFPSMALPSEPGKSAGHKEDASVNANTDINSANPAQAQNPGNTCVSAKESTSELPQWVRMVDDIQYCRPWSTSFNASGAYEQMNGIDSLVEEQCELAVEDVIANDFYRLHDAREEPDVCFAPLRPTRQTPRGNLYDRIYLAEQHAIDTAALYVSEPMLRDLEILDSMDRPFSAQAGVIYLRSPDSLLTKRDISKGPLKGVSDGFNLFLNQLSRTQDMPTERIKQHPDDPTLMRYSFCINNFEVCYNLAPNVSSLISGSTMGPQDNQCFYSLLRERGIYILWFDVHPGDLDAGLAWHYIDHSANKRQSQQSRSHSTSETSVFSSQTAHHNRNGPWKSRNGPRRDQELALSPPTGCPIVSRMYKGALAPSDKPAQSILSKTASSKSDSKSKSSAQGSQHRFKAREFIQKAMHITRRYAPDNSDSTVSRCSSEPSLADTACNEDTDADVPERCRAHSPESSHSSGSEVALLEALEHYVPHNQSSKKRSEATVPPTPNSTPTATPKVLQDAAPRESAKGIGPSSQAEMAGGSQTGGELGANTPADEPAKPNIRILIAIAPIPHTGGRLVKVGLSATGGSKEMNADFVQMTGPLLPQMVIESKNLAHLLSATVLDAAANMASLNCDDFSVVCKRIGMIRHIIETYCAKYKSVDDVHKFIFPAGRSGLANTLDIPLANSRASSFQRGQQREGRT
ncbi:hypothetical protein H4R26_000772 [Coemansia thaxteri]|uniref:Rap-GAP domain-containing protein n=1 Tax=Coemansia thaxteri TaxID=2663907 RepID=A0A9W8BMZ2_9FUNG|nr:hypothetical protein H4R26_000772 [Coemansia thaxteri]